MSSASERAEARRKAILAKRGDRLAKLTTTARGDEGGYLNEDAPSFSRSFLGEESSIDMPTPPRLSVSPSPGPTPSQPTVVSSTPPTSLFSDVDDSVWSPELQDQFRQALLNANPTRSAPPSRVPSGASASGRDSSPSSFAGNEQPGNEPLADIFAALGGGATGGSPSGLDMLSLLQNMRQGPQAATPETEAPKRTKAIRSLIQLVSTWLLLAYFVFFLEPGVYKQHVGSLDVGRWSRWAVLGEEKKALGLLPTFKVQAQPTFFWVFVALEAAVHFTSVRKLITSRSEGNSPLDILGPFAKIPSIINIVLLFLNGLGGVVFGLGVTVYLASYATPK
ncbi:hypothetical protein P691DRAFT_776601 [Macrolepiota fuliginosa MF-IS2]|uniref:Golgi to ER traffic protein 2 n=1 Tax=Macrolepiota fuliginosa MF-IS2 TaxID=1400762 RepID=A0A9P5XB50_9AGAR|nr:hypothetical protein P691DRAFT_776601 [Macrolepiota fuliginosa MF-IS2]